MARAAAFVCATMFGLVAGMVLGLEITVATHYADYATGRVAFRVDGQCWSGGKEWPARRVPGGDVVCYAGDMPR